MTLGDPHRREGPVPVSTAAAELADQVSARLGWLRLEIGTGPSSSPRTLTASSSPSENPASRLQVTADMFAPGGLGQVATQRWRAGLAAATTRQYGVPPPPAYAATFVLQWVLQVLAHPAAEVAALGPFVLDVAAAPLLVDLDPVWWSPRRVVVEPVALVLQPEPRRRWELAELGYTVVATRLARDYDAGVAMSSRQRLGAVRDIWSAARAQAAVGAAAVGEPLPVSAAAPAGAPFWRESCCFLFVLPGASACAACPRRAPRPGSHTGR